MIQKKLTKKLTKKHSKKHSKKNNEIININSSQFEKDRIKLKKKMDTCKKHKCKKYIKEKNKEEKLFNKEQDIECPQKSSQEFYDCSTIFYNKSKLKKLFDKYVNCYESKCSKEINLLRELVKNKEMDLLRNLIKKSNNNLKQKGGEDFSLNLQKRKTLDLLNTVECQI